MDRPDLTLDEVSIPDSVDAITSSWVDDVLHSAGVLQKAHVKELSVEVSPAGSGGGYMSDLVWLRLRYDIEEPDTPNALVLKRPQAAVNPMLVSRYEAEVNFYRHFQAQSPITAPLCYYSRFDPSTGNFALLFADLRELKAGDELSGCSYEEAALAVREVARLHAAFWQKDGIEEVLYPKAPRLSPSPPGSDAWAKLEADFAGRLPASIPDVIRLLTSERQSELHQLSRQPPQTLLHGDFRLDNMLFRTGEGHDSSNFVLLDWQLARRGRGPADLAWFLGLSVDAERRQAWQADLLLGYHQELERSGVSDYELDDCILDYRLSLLQTLSSCAVGNMMDLETGRAAEKLNQMVVRAAKAVDDNDCLALLATTHS